MIIVPHAEVLGSPRSSSAHGREGRHRCSFGDRPDVWNLDGGESSEVLYLVPILSIQSAQISHLCVPLAAAPPHVTACR